MRFFKSSRTKQLKKKGSIYFNFSKFEKLLDGLRYKGINILSDDYPVASLKAYKDFEYFFDNFADQEIKIQLLFYRNQFDELYND